MPRQEQRIIFRVADEDRAMIEALASTHRETISGLIRRALRSVRDQKPLLSPAELEALHQVREQIRRAGVNLTVLLRNLHLYGHGVADAPPPVAELEALAAELGETRRAVEGIIERYP